MKPITPPLPPRHHSTVTSLPHVSITERHGKGQNKVIILPEAFQELKVMISYGRRSPMNFKEQKYAGFGHLFSDKNGSSVTVVSHFIQIHTMNRNPVGASNLGPNGEWNPGLDFLEYYREEFLEAWWTRSLTTLVQSSCLKVTPTRILAFFSPIQTV